MDKQSALLKLIEQAIYKILNDEHLITDNQLQKLLQL